MFLESSRYSLRYLPEKLKIRHREITNQPKASKWLAYNGGARSSRKMRSARAMDDRDFSCLLTRKCKRKEIRKTSKKVATAVQAQLSDKKGKKRAKRKRQAEKKQQKLLKQEEEPQELEAFLKEAEEVRRQRMREELDDDDAEIQRLEKKLNSRKVKKNKAVSAIEDDQMLTDEFLDDNEDGGFDFSDLGKMPSKIQEGVGSEEGSVMERGSEECSELEDSSEDDLDAAVDQQNGEETTDSVQTPAMEVIYFDPALVNLANKAKMGSETRRNVFCTIMSSEKDTAFERLKKLKLDGPQEREIIRVCVECALLESQHNQFYSMLVNKFCDSHARFQVTAQYVLWDLIKDLESLKEHQQQNLAQMVADLFKFQGVGLSVLRIVDFSNLTQPASTFLKRTFYYFLSSSRDSVIRDAFLRVINSAKKKNRFSEGLQLFFEQPLADLLPVSNGYLQKVEKKDDLEIFKKRLALVKRLWSMV